MVNMSEDNLSLLRNNPLALMKLTGISIEDMTDTSFSVLFRIQKNSTQTSTYVIIITQESEGHQVSSTTIPMHIVPLKVMNEYLTESINYAVRKIRTVLQCYEDRKLQYEQAEEKMKDHVHMFGTLNYQYIKLRVALDDGGRRVQKNIHMYYKRDEVFPYKIKVSGPDLLDADNRKHVEDLCEDLTKMEILETLGELLEDV